MIVNPDPALAARAVALVKTPGGTLLAALDATHRTLVAGVKRPTLSLYDRGDGGFFSRIAEIAVPGTLPSLIAAGDLNGDGRDDLVIADAGSSQVFVYFQNAQGGFNPLPDRQIAIGAGPAALVLTDLDGVHGPDIVVANRLSGDISVLPNDATHAFATEIRFRASNSLYGAPEKILPGLPPAVHSSAETSAVVPIGAGGALLVVNTGLDSASILPSAAGGGLFQPRPEWTFAAGREPTAAVAGRFDAHQAAPGVAVLDRGSDSITVYEPTATGGFEPVFTTSAGNAPTGLTVADINGDGTPDLLVGNEYGDVLILQGNGDGTFQPYRRVDLSTALAVADLDGDGKPDFVFSNQTRDQVSVQLAGAAPTVFQNRSQGLLAPGAVVLADLDGDGTKDLIVADSGGNNILVYRGLGGGRFGPPVNGPQGFFVGTDPVGVTVADVNNDGIPDLVVSNKGSNDISILFGKGQGAAWTLEAGPRLKTGAGPVATVVQDVNGDRVPDILVSNSQSNNVTLLPGVGAGFFNDRNPVSFPVGLGPGPLFVGPFDGKPDLVTVNRGSNDLTLISDFLGRSPVTQSIASGGLSPIAAFAGDFNQDGYSDLVVANSGNGHFGLLLGGPNSLELTQTLFLPDLPDPSSLVFSSVAAGRVDGFASAADQEVTALVSFLIGAATTTPDLSPLSLLQSLSSATPLLGGMAQVALLLPLRDTANTLVTTVLIVPSDSTTGGSPSTSPGPRRAAMSPPRRTRTATSTKVSCHRAARRARETTRTSPPRSKGKTRKDRGSRDSPPSTAS